MELEEETKNNNHRSGEEEEEVCRAHPKTSTTPSAEFVFQWGNRKRLRCMKIQIKNDSKTEKTRVRVDREVVKAKKDSTNHNNLDDLDRSLSLLPPPPPHPLRTVRNSDTCSAMKGHSNGFAIRFSPDRGEERAQDSKKNNVLGGASPSCETAQDSKKGGSSSGSDTIPGWIPKFVIALTNKEKEEDFMAIKGSKLPQRPKKRAKFVQRTLNLVSPGTWLGDLTLERYEVREKKISKKRPRGLKAMGNLDSDSE